MAACHFISHLNLTFLSHIDSHDHISARRQFITLLSSEDANINYPMNACAAVTLGVGETSISCGVCVPCKEDDDCMDTDIDEVEHIVKDNADAIFTWDYEKGARPALNKLYEKAKTAQWNGETDIDWSIDVDPEKGLVPDMGIGIYGTPIWDRLTEKEKAKLRHEAIPSQLCQVLPGEQGALLATAQIEDAEPWYEAKQ